MTAPPILWRPSPERIERATITDYARWLERDAWSRAAGLREPVGVVGGRPGGLLGLDLGALRRDRVGPVRAGAGLAGDAGCRVVPRRAPQLRRARAPAPRRRRCRDSPCLGATAARRGDAGRAAGRGGAGRGRSPRARRRAGRPRRRLPAEHPGGDHRVPCLRVDRRDLVELLAGLRCPQRDRPLRADHAEGAARRRRLPLRRQGLRPHSGLEAAARVAAHGRAHGRARLSRPEPVRRRASATRSAGRSCSGWARGRRSPSSTCRSIIRSGCSTARARPGCRRRSCTATAGSWSRC